MSAALNYYIIIVIINTTMPVYICKHTHKRTSTLSLGDLAESFSLSALPPSNLHHADSIGCPPPALVCASASRRGVEVCLCEKLQVGCWNRVWLPSSDSDQDLSSTSSVTLHARMPTHASHSRVTSLLCPCQPEERRLYGSFTQN